MANIDLIATRLHNHKLSSSGFKHPADVVRWLGAVQAQDFNAAKWALALRMRNGTHALVEDAYNRGEILRTHLMRPTWHFVAPEDIRWLLALTAPRVNQKAGPNYRKLELDAAVFKRANRVLTKALRDGKHLTRAELGKALNEAGIVAGDSIRLGHLMFRAELDGVVCSGPMRGKQFTYALLDERAPESTAVGRDEALAKLTQRYFTSHGPATVPDFVWWSGLTVADARNGIASVKSQIAEFVIDDKVYWSSKVKNAKRAATSAYLLPAFDEYFVAYKDRQPLFVPGEMSTWDVLGPTVVIDGVAAGRWKRSNNRIEFNFSRSISNPEKRTVSAAVDRYATYLNVILVSP